MNLRNRISRALVALSGAPTLDERVAEKLVTTEKSFPNPSYPWESRFQNWQDHQHEPGRANYSKPFRNHPYVFKAISSIANAAGSVDFKLMRRQSNGKHVEVTSGIEYETLKRPSSMMLEDMFFSQIAGWLQMAPGETFIRIIREGAARRLVFLSPECIEIKLSASGELFYEYRHPGKGTPEQIPDSDIIHVKTAFNPYDPMRGMGPLRAAACSYQDDLDLRLYNRNTVRSGGMPAGFLDTSGEGAHWPTKEELEAFRESMKKLQDDHQKVVIAPGKWQQAGQTPEEMAFLELRRMSFKEVGGVFGVPPQMMGDFERDQADAWIQMITFHVDTMRPLYRLMANAITLSLWKIRGVSPLLSQDVFCRYDDSQVPAVAELTQRLRATDITELDAGLVTINDVLERREMEPKPWGGVWWQSGIRIPVTGPEVPDIFGAGAPVPDDDEGEEEDGDKEYDATSDRLEIRSLTLLALPFEQQIIRALESVWDEVERDVIARVKAGKGFELLPVGTNGDRFTHSASKADESIRDPFDIAEIAGKVANRTAPILRLAQVSGGSRGLKLARAKGQRFKVDAQPAINQLARQVQRFAVPVTETTWKRVQATLIEGLAEGEPHGKLVSRVQQAMGVRRAEAANTATTEVNAALNGGVSLAFKQSEVVIEKRWLKGGPKSRPAHKQAHGQTVGVTDKFLVGGERLEFPGDSAGSPENVCNCACTIVPARIRA